ncbi:lipid IV(A) 3-deoxy-D-manno-octulosonic acid transferase [Aliidiomarina sanyensis]|nr:lipid IV(A) 3-deoxy-D-manno-octulosonic acid transferase [Aliidiomarina sanyensis]
MGKSDTPWGVRLYSALLISFTPLVLFYFWWHGRKNPDYRSRLRERFARQAVPAEARGAIVFHCVSVGEFMAARPLIERFVQEDTGRPIVVTCMTPTGAKLIQETFAHVIGDRVFQYYMPLDIPSAVKRFYDKLEPRAMVILETELWPNLVLQGRARQVPILLVNGRMSDQSKKGYTRMSWLFEPVWGALNYCGAQSERIADHFRAIGVRDEALEIAGNLKFDVQIPPRIYQEIEQFRELFGTRRVITAGSTHEGEEDIILGAFQDVLQSKPSTLLILVPRHQERFEDVAKKLDEAGVRYVRRSSGRPILPETQVLLADTMGELLIWYGLATVAFVGGSLIERGGHNPLEPMAFGVPVVSGRHVFNFVEVYDQLDQRQAVRWVQDRESLFATLSGLLTTVETAQRLGAQARQIFEQHKGATARTKSRIEQVMEGTGE